MKMALYNINLMCYKNIIQRRRSDSEIPLQSVTA